MRRLALSIILFISGAGLLLAGALASAGPAAAAPAVPAQVATQLALHSAPNPSVVGQAVTVTATVTASTGNTPPAGTITFLATGGTMTNGTATLAGAVNTMTSSASTTVTYSLPGNNYTISAAYTPANADAFGPSGPVTITQAVTAVATTSPSPSISPSPSVSTSHAATPTATPTMGMTTAPATVITQPGATVTPMGPVGTGGGGSLGDAMNAGLITAGSAVILAGAGAGLSGLVIRRRRNRKS